MKATIGAAAIMFASCQSVLGEPCEEKFVRLMIDGNEAGPVKIHVTQDIKGGMTSKNYFYQVETGHWMTEMIEPANLDWVLTYGNTMFTSSDKGTTWKKLRAVDSTQTAEKSKKDREENAATTSNAACGEDVLEGVAHDTVEADFQTLQNFKTDNHYKYWVNRETGFIAKATYQTKGKGFESFVTQLIEPAPGLQLPKPE